MHGSSVVLHTRLSSVVFPAFALPITRIQKRLYLARSFAASSGSIGLAATVGAERLGVVGSATGGDEGTGGSAPTTGEGTMFEGEFKRL